MWLESFPQAASFNLIFKGNLLSRDGRGIILELCNKHAAERLRLLPVLCSSLHSQGRLGSLVVPAEKPGLRASKRLKTVFGEGRLFFLQQK